MNMIRRVLASALAVGIALATAAAWAGPATDHVQGAVDRVLKLVQDPELKKPANTEKRRAQIREVARSLFDFEEMAKRGLARHWAARSPDQKKRFTELFSDLLESSYVGKIEGYGGEKITYLPEQPDGDTVTVRSKLSTQRGTEIPIDYRLQKTGDRLAVYDVVIEGVSLVANYRTQFNKVITQSSYDELVKKLEQKQLEVAEEQKTRKPAPKTPAAKTP
ncbi:MAG: MlaC/ttg2D family ABC transporter substrate-binding protein [Candidatus Rokuibacteriota bacterium]